MLVLNGYRISVLQGEKRSVEGWWQNNVNVLNLTELAQLKMIKMVNFRLHIFYHNFFKKEKALLLRK